MLGAALLVVLSRNIIRSGLCMIVVLRCASPASTCSMGATLVAAAQVLVYIGAISVLILFAVMLTQSKSGPGPAGVPHAGLGRPAIASAIVGLLLIMSVVVIDHLAAGHAGTHRDRARVTSRTLLFADYVLAFEVVSVLLLAAVVGGIFLAKRERRRPRPDADASSTVSHQSSTPTSCWPGLMFAIGTFGFLARRNAIAMLMSIELMLNARQPRDRRVRHVHAVAAGARVGHRAVRHGRRGRRGDRGPRHRHRHLPQPAGRRSSTSTRDAGVARAPPADAFGDRPPDGRRRLDPRAADLLLLLLPIAGFALHGAVRPPAVARGASRSIAGAASSSSSGPSPCYLVVPGAHARAPSATRPSRSRSGRGSRPATSRSTSTSRRQPDRGAAARGHDDRHARARLLHRVHGPRPRPLALLRLPQPVHVPHAAAGPRRRTTCWCSPAWELVGLSSYLLIGFWYHKRSRGARQQEGVPRQPRRRRRASRWASWRSGPRSAR